MELLKTISIILLFYAFIMYIVFSLSLWFILKKERKQEIKAIIPILNFCEYFKICKSPFWTFFIPFLNLIVLICLPYRLAYQYQCTKGECILACLLPFAALPYIAFSNKTNKDIKPEFHYIKNSHDIESLENKLNQAYEEETFLNESSQVEKQQEIQDTNEELNYHEFEEEIIDESAYQQFEKGKEEEKEETMIELADEEALVDHYAIDLMEEKAESNTDIRDVETTIEEISEEKANTEAIAFGGMQKEELLAQAKKDDLKCERCGSSLVGATDTCPGCGAKIV